jgi:hypothetical protein
MIRSLTTRPLPVSNYAWCREFGSQRCISSSFPDFDEALVPKSSFMQATGQQRVVPNLLEQGILGSQGLAALPKSCSILTITQLWGHRRCERGLPSKMFVKCHCTLVGHRGLQENNIFHGYMRC